MKKLKKILSVLSAVMIISTCSVSVVYADETATEPTEATETTESTEEMITDVEEIAKLLSDFGEECQLPQFSAHACYVSEHPHLPCDMVSVNWVGDNGYGQVRYLVNCFIEEKT